MQLLAMVVQRNVSKRLENLTTKIIFKRFKFENVYYFVCVSIL